MAYLLPVTTAAATTTTESLHIHIAKAEKNNTIQSNSQWELNEQKQSQTIRRMKCCQGNYFHLL